MTVTTFDFEGGTDGGQVVVGGGITGVSTGWPEYESGAAFHGVMGIESTGSQWFEVANPDSTTGSGSVYLSMTVNPGSGNNRVVQFYNSTTNLGSLRFNSTGTIQIATGGNILSGANFTTGWSAGDDFRFDWELDYTGTTLTIDMRIFKNANVEGTTADETINRALTSVASAPATYRVGSTTAGTWNLLVDSLRVSDATEWLGPFPTSSPQTITGQVATLTLSALAGGKTAVVTQPAQVATLALSALAGTKTTGAVTQPGQVATLALSAQAGTQTTGTVATPGQVATLTLTAVAGTLASPVTKAGQVATLALTGQSGAVGNFTTLPAQVGTLAFTAQAGTVTAGAATITGQVAALALTAPAGTETTGGVSVAGQVATVAWSAVAGTVAFLSSQPAQVATLTWSAVAGTVTAGAATKVGQTAQLTLSALAGTRSAGAATQAAQTATLTFTAQVGTKTTSGMSIPAHLAAVVLDANAGTIADTTPSTTIYTFNAGTANTNVAVGGGITAVSGAPPKYQTVAIQHGAMGVEAISNTWLEVANPDSITGSGSVYVQAVVNPGSGETRAVWVVNAGTHLASLVRFHSSGAMGMMNSGHILSGAAFTTTWVAGDRFRFDWQMSYAGTTLTVDLRIFKNANIEGFTPDETVSRSITSVASAPVSYRVGNYTSGTWDNHIDTLRVDEDMVWLGPYAPTQAGQVATLALTAVAGTRTAGTATRTCPPATLTFTAVPGALIGALSAQPALLTFTAQAGTVTAGTATKAAQVATLALSATAGAVTPSSTTLAAQIASLTLSGVAGTVTAAAVTKAATAATVAYTANPGAVTVGATTITGQVATLALVAVAGTVTPATATIPATPALLTFEAVPGEGGAGGVFGAQIAHLTYTAVPGTISEAATIVGQVATVAFTAGTGTIRGPQTATGQIATLAFTASSGVTVGAATVQTAATATLALTAVAGQPVAGNADRAGQTAVLALTAGAGAVTATATVPAAPAVLALEAIPAGIVGGSTTIPAAIAVLLYIATEGSIAYSGRILITGPLQLLALDSIHTLTALDADHGAATGPVLALEFAR